MNQEYLLQETDFLVSQTDSMGVILFANEDFCKIAGYSLEELIGQEHNIVRHPDMPKTAFRDLWETIKAGKTWEGYVKNKTKNGDFYWVYSIVYPIRSGKSNEVTYISCRRKPSREEIVIASDLYKTMH